MSNSSSKFIAEYCRSYSAIFLGLLFTYFSDMAWNYSENIWLRPLAIGIISAIFFVIYKVGNDRNFRVGLLLSFFVSYAGILLYNNM